jgi:hypothetical protein
MIRTARALGLALAVLLASTQHATAAIVYVSAASTTCSNSSVASVTCTLAGSISAGSLVVVSIRTGVAVATVTDDQGNTYFQEASVTNTVRHNQYASIVATGGVLQITITTGTSTVIHAAVQVFTGIAGSSGAGPTVGQTSTASASSNTTLSTGSITTAAADALVVSALGLNSTGGTLTQPSGFTKTNTAQCGISHQIETATGTFNPNWTWTTAGVSAGTTVSYVASGAGGGGGGAGSTGILLGILP